MKTSLAALAALSLAAAVQAKLPPPSEADKAKAAEAAARTAWTNNVANFQLCKAMDKVVAEYRAEAKQAGKETKPGAQLAPCADPGPFAYTPPRPIEAAGAHSPPEKAVSPPSTTATDASLKGAKK